MYYPFTLTSYGVYADTVVYTSDRMLSKLTMTDLMRAFHARIPRTYINLHCVTWFLTISHILNHNQSVQLPHGLNTHHLECITQTISSEYTYQVSNMKLFQLQVYIKLVEWRCQETPPFTVVVHSLQYSLLIAYVMLSRQQVQKAMGIAHSYCYKLCLNAFLKILDPSSSFWSLIF